MMSDPGGAAPPGRITVTPPSLLSEATVVVGACGAAGRSCGGEGGVGGVVVMAATPAGSSRWGSVMKRVVST